MLFFSAKGKGKYDGSDENGTPIFFEARPNAFKERYSGKSGFCYTLPSDTFTGATGDKTEVVSEVGVNVISKKEIKDIGLEFEKLIKDGKFHLVSYNSSKYKTEEMCNEEVNHKEWVKNYYKGLISDYQNQSQS